MQCAGARKRVKTFELRITFLAEQCALTADDAARLHLMRGLHNEASHPKQQDIFTPGMALDAVTLTAEFVNKLFPLSDPQRTSGA